ncbi:FAD-dependent oxidoreductase [Erysipelothrix urinaevulpis]|uniref:FAD-dependent oxidoreductase n=1 Tax=Erysipelothrix urinaevulpis TaxID=2683717 RepID=UPI00135920F2|nr:FAD-dependent oxidoreductase [Erysipelothrix urinaevulpis]
MMVDVAIIGGGLGGVAAALAALRNGKKVFMSEESSCLGGQVTSQGVPPDEHDYIEKYGRTASYQTYRENIRDYYKRFYPLTQNAQADLTLNPGNGWVSALCHEPVVSMKVLHSMLNPYILSGQLDLRFNTNCIWAKMNDNTIESVGFKQGHQEFSISAQFYLDASEIGDLLPLSQTDYVTGSESKAKTGEYHASDHEDPLDMQAITWCFAVSLEDEGDYTIEKPELYDFFKQHRSDFWTGSQLSWTYVEPHTLKPVEGSMTKEKGKVDLFGYRKILDRHNFKDGFLSGDVTLVNWPQNDYWLGPIYEIDDQLATMHYHQAKELSRSFLYWLQTEADGHGYPNLKPRGDVMGTDDGFAMRPYIRESRRIVGEFTVLESHIGAEMRTDTRAELFEDSVGVGHYHLDLHPSTGGRTYIDMESYPFQIPMGALIPQKTSNLLAAGKTISTTHITNGTYRLHPVEWNIGESAALMATYCLDHEISINTLYHHHIKEFQEFIVKQGVQIEWPEEVLKIRENYFSKEN